MSKAVIFFFGTDRLKELQVVKSVSYARDPLELRERRVRNSRTRTTNGSVLD